MRNIRLEERNKRGCDHCMDVIPPEYRGTWKTSRRCPYDECPYHVLDDVSTYREYLKKTANIGIVKVLEALE